MNDRVGMTTQAAASSPAIGRLLLIALAAGLCVAAAFSIVAITGVASDDTVGKVIGVALGFALFSATSAAGAMLLRRGWESVHLLGWATVALSAVSFCAVVLATFWEESATFLGCAALATLACAHASIVTRDARDDDAVTILALSWTSIVLAVSFAAGGIARIVGALGDSGDFWRAMAVGLILVLLTFALAPILRRVRRGSIASA